jgi:hypothetical protein
MSNPRHPKQPKPLPVLRLTLAALAGAAAALLLACGSSGNGLIPAANAGPLQSDFEAVAQAAQSGNGSCLSTESALGKTEQDFLALPASVDAGLRRRLREGIDNLRKVSLAMCAQPSPTATATTAAPTTTTPTTTTGATTTPTATTPTSTATTPASPAPPNNGGGTPAPEEGEEGAGKGKGKGKDEGEAGAEAGGATPEGR